jgi:hypothetical protein
MSGECKNVNKISYVNIVNGSGYSNATLCIIRHLTVVFNI